MRWPSIETLSAIVPLPGRYVFAPLGERDLPEVIAALRTWHPAIGVGVSSVYLREDFYRRRVCLDGGDERDIHAFLVRLDNELVGFWSFEREVDSLAIYGRTIIIAPAHRGTKLAAHMLEGTEALGRTMGAAFMYALVTLSHPFAQRALEHAGYRLLGFFPGYDREEVAPGVVKRVYQAVYARLLVPADQVHYPNARNLTPRARALFEMLFDDVALAAS